jgi:hypothetical protein
LDFGFWILDFGFWILDFGFWILDFGFWMEEEDQARDAAATGKRIGFASLRLSHPKSNIQNPTSTLHSLAGFSWHLRLGLQ